MADEGFGLGLHVGRLNVRYTFNDRTSLIGFLEQLSTNKTYRSQIIEGNLAELALSEEWRQETIEAIAAEEIWYDIGPPTSNALHAVDTNLTPRERYLKATTKVV